MSLVWPDSFDYYDTPADQYDFTFGSPTISATAAHTGPQGLVCPTGAGIGKTVPAAATYMSGCWFSMPSSPIAGGLGTGIMQFNDGNPFAGDGVDKRLDRSGWAVWGVESERLDHSPPLPATNTLDTNSFTVWSSANGGSSWIAYDLAGARTFDALQIVNRPAPETQGQPKHCDFQISNDGVNWTTIKTFVGVNSNSAYTVSLGGVYTAEWVKLVIHDVYNTEGLSNVVFAEFYLLSSTAYQVGIYVKGDGSVVASRGDGTIFGISTFKVAFSTWHHMEAKVTISSGSPLVQIKVDGLEYLNITTIPTNYTSSQITAVIFGDWSQGGPVYIDDVYIADTGGSTNNDLLGMCIVRRLTFSGDGDSYQFTSSDSQPDYLDVGEVDPDDNATYASGVSGQRDKYAVNPIDLTADATIVGVSLKGRANNA